MSEAIFPSNIKDCAEGIPLELQQKTPRNDYLSFLR